jgi:hypothetical protein
MTELQERISLAEFAEGAEKSIRNFWNLDWRFWKVMGSARKISSERVWKRTMCDERDTSAFYLNI